MMQNNGIRLLGNNTLVLVNFSKRVKLINCRWIFKKKYTTNITEKCKVRLKL